MKETKIKDKGKASELSLILQLNFGKDVNLARIKFIAMFLCALSKAQTVNREKIATLFGGKADGASSHRRIQRFMASYNLCSSMVARLIVSLLFNSVRIGEFRSLEQIYIIGEQHCYLAASKVKGRDYTAELQIIVSFDTQSIYFNLCT